MRPTAIATLPPLIQRIEATHPHSVLRLQCIQEAPGGTTVTLVIEDARGRGLDKLRRLKAAMETAARDIIHYPRAWLQETGRREQIDSMHHQLMQLTIEDARGISISIDASTVEENIVRHLSGRDTAVNYTQDSCAGDAEV